MNFKDSIRNGLRNYANFSGVVGRSEYWYWILFVVLVNVILTLPAIAFGELEAVSIVGAFPLVQALLDLALFIPTLALTIRRLRDAGKSPVHLVVFFVTPIPMVILFAIVLQIYSDFTGAEGLLMVGPLYGLFAAPWVAAGWMSILLAQPTRNIQTGNK